MFAFSTSTNQGDGPIATTTTAATRTSTIMSTTTIQPSSMMPTTDQHEQLDFRTVPTTIAATSTSTLFSTLLPTNEALLNGGGLTSTTQATTSTTTNSATETQHHHHHTDTVNVYNVPPAKFQPDRLATLDLIIIVVYLCLLISTSISTMLRRKKKPGTKSLDSHILAGRKMNWFTVGASIFASNMGSEHFIGLSGSAAASGIAVGAFEINALLILQLATWIFLPVLIVSKICTLPEYMSKRFGGRRIRTYLAILSIMLYIFTKISVNLYSGGIFIQQALGWNLYTSAIVILMITSVMTVTGGLKGAMYVDTLQCLVMTIGASIVAAKAFIVIGGWHGLRHKYSLAVPVKVPANLTHCAQPNVHAFQMLRDWDDPDMPWIGFILGQTPASIWYWAADQMMVQRFLSARSLAHVQGSSVFAGYLKILPLFFIIIPGMISRCLYTDEVGCVDPVECHNYCQSTVSCSNTAYPRLVLELMPVGARGMMVASMVAALMGDLVNVFNSASALFSCDIWPLVRRKSTEKELLVVGRIFVFVLVLASILWIPVIQEMQGGQLFIYIQAIAALFAPPIAAVYICAVLCKRTNEKGAFWSLMIGFSLGATRMALSFIYREPSCGQFEDERPWILKQVHYMYFAAFLFWISLSSTLIISYLTKPPNPFRLIRTTYWTRFDTHIRKDDKNVFEMKYNGATSMPNDGSDKAMINGSTSGLRNSDDNIVDLESYGAASKTSQQRLFTIDEHEGQNDGGQYDGIDNQMMNDSSLIDGKSDKSADSHQQVKSNDNSKKRQYRLPPSAPPPASSSVASAGKFIASTFGVATGQVGAKLGAVKAKANHFNQNKIKFQNLPDDGSEVGDQDQDDDDEEDERAQLDDNLDGATGSGTYKCLDNSVALLIKTRYEELMLRVALFAVILVALGIFILFSIPPAPLPKDLVEILKQS